MHTHPHGSSKLKTLYSTKTFFQLLYKIWYLCRAREVINEYVDFFNFLTEIVFFYNASGFSTIYHSFAYLIKYNCLTPTGDACKKRWRSLRTKYGKELKVQRTFEKSGSAAVVIKKWKYFDMMHFLKCHIQPKE